MRARTRTPSTSTTSTTSRDTGGGPPARSREDYAYDAYYHYAIEGLLHTSGTCGSEEGEGGNYGDITLTPADVPIQTGGDPLWDE